MPVERVQRGKARSGHLQMAVWSDAAISGWHSKGRSLPCFLRFGSDLPFLVSNLTSPDCCTVLRVVCKGLLPWRGKSQDSNSGPFRRNRNPGFGDLVKPEIPSCLPQAAMRMGKGEVVRQSAEDRDAGRPEMPVAVFSGLVKAFASPGKRGEDGAMGVRASLRLDTQHTLRAWQGIVSDA